jgi:hypothetical protein
MVGDHYEVKVDGEWTLVPNDKINNVVAPDGGAHVCAPRQVGPNKGVLFCVVLPPESWPKARTQAVADKVIKWWNAASSYRCEALEKPA